MSTGNNAGPAKKQRPLITSLMKGYPFLQEVHDDGKKVLCTICNQELLAVSMQRFQSHVESKTHQKNLNHNEGKDSKSKKFSLKWLQDVRFDSWLQAVPEDETKFRCTLCQVERSCACGVSNVVRHAEMPDHVKKCKENGLKTLDDLSAEVIYESGNSFNVRLKTREVEFVQLGCDTNTPYRTMPKFLKFFQETDPAILQKMTASATKVSAVVRNFLAPCEESRLIEILQTVKFSVYIDETTDPNGSVKWMSFLVRFVDPETLETAMGLPRLIELDSTKLNAEGLFGAFKQYMSDNNIPFSNILAVSCDNASVMVGNIKSFKTLILKENPLIIFIPCICHKLALIAKDACKNIPSYIEKLLQSIVHHMNGTKRSEAFEHITSALQGTSLKILDYAITRWLGRHDCIKRVLELYDSLLDYFRELCFGKNEGFEEIKDQLFDSKTKAYLTFLQYILCQFNKINVYFQSSETRVHELHSKSVQFLKFIAKHFLKPAILPFLAINKVDVSSSQNQKSLDAVSFGPDCDEILDELSHDIGANAAVIQEIRQNCFNFYVEAVSQILERLYYIHDEFYSRLVVFNVDRALIDDDRKISFDDIKYFASKFGQFNEVALFNEWRHLQQKFHSQPELNILGFDAMWKTVLSHRGADGNELFPHLRCVVGCIRSLPHSNAPAERTFSLLPDISTKKRNRLSNQSISALTVAKSATKENEKSARNVKFTEDQLSQMMTKNLYEPQPKKANLLTLYKGSE